MTTCNKKIIFDKFIRECESAGFKVENYRGKFLYEGPSVSTTNIQTVIRATSMQVQWDLIDNTWIVYPVV